MSLGLIIAGLLGIRVVLSQNLWDSLGNQENSRVPFGVLSSKDGVVRIKNAGSFVWHDVAGAKQTVVNGDTVFTGENGVALLESAGGEESLEIAPNSLLVIESRVTALDGNWFKHFLSSLISTSPRSGNVEIQRGHFSLVVKKPGMPLAVRHAGQDYRVDNHVNPAPVVFPPSAPAISAPVATAPVATAPVATAPVAPAPVAAAPAETTPALKQARSHAGDGNASFQISRPKLSFVPGKASASKPGESAPTEQLTGESSASNRLNDTLDLDHITVHLQWKPITGVVEYQLTVTHPDGSVVSTQVIRKPVFDFSITNLDHTRFKYQIGAKNQDGKDIRSGWLPIEIVLSPPLQKLPREGETLKADGKALFTWERTSLTDRYELQFSHSADFSDVIRTEQTRVNVLVIGGLEPGHYFWRVRGSARSLESPWSAARPLVVEP